MENSDSIKESPKLVKDMFNTVHKDYCEFYKNFQKRLAKVFQDDLKEEDLYKISEWAIEYKQSMENAKWALEDFEEQIKNEKLELSDERVRENEIFNKVKNTFIPYQLIYTQFLLNNN